MHPRPKWRSASEAGFSLVELLVVMLILGLLAAIAIPAFFGERDRARDADAKSAVRTAATAAETLGVANDGNYNGPGGVTVPRLVETEGTLAEANLSVLAVDTHSYALRVTSQTSNTFDYIRNDDGTTTLSCAPMATDGCPGDGTWD